MDPIGASCLSLYKPDENNLNDLIVRKYSTSSDATLRQLVTDTRSLSIFEVRTWKSLLPQILASLLAASFHIGNGISLAYSAVLIKQLEQDDSDFHPTKNENSWMASVLIVVAPPASIVGGLLMDRFGRLNTIKIAGIPGVLGWSLIALASNIPMIIFGRLLVGIASAWGTSPGIVYITEIASSRLRMSLMAIAPAYVSLGMVLTYWGGWYLHWRVLGWICNIFVVIPSLVCIFLHESPSWLIMKGKYDAAKKSLEWLHKYQPQPLGKNVTFAELQMRLLQEEQRNRKDEQNENQTQRKGAKFIMKEFLKPTGYKPFLILSGLFFFQHFSGIYITMFYSISFIEEAGSSINGYLASVMIGLVRLVMSVVSIYILKTFKRRNLIFTSTIGMATCMLIAGLWTMWIKEGTTTLKWVPVMALLVYVVCSTVGLLPIPNMLMAELFPLEIRGIGYSVCYSFCCILMFAALQSYFYLNDLLGGASHLQWFFAVICLGGAVYSYILLPETYGLKLTDITEYFKHRFVYIGHYDSGSVRDSSTYTGKVNDGFSKNVNITHNNVKTITSNGTNKEVNKEVV